MIVPCRLAEHWEVAANTMVALLEVVQTDEPVAGGEPAEQPGADPCALRADNTCASVVEKVIPLSLCVTVRERVCCRVFCHAGLPAISSAASLSAGASNAPTRGTAGPRAPGDVGGKRGRGVRHWVPSPLRTSNRNKTSTKVLTSCAHHRHSGTHSLEDGWRPRVDEVREIGGMPDAAPNVLAQEPVCFFVSFADRRRGAAAAESPGPTRADRRPRRRPPDGEHLWPKDAQGEVQSS